ncbi:MAG: cytochrome c [Rhodospirillaceae bacterium]|nr:cytochrome c [Rhodospirillaceae bacterium]
MQKKIVIGIAAAVVLGAVLFVYAGIFNVAADEHHSKPFYALMETVRERSIAVRSRGILVPPLDDSAMISSGGADYNEMCTGCHLRPGIQESELSAAMYPQPPNLSQIRRKDPAQTFWIIKHGIKMSGMPAWGPTHDDQRMWAMVAFLQRLPELTPEQYQILTARTDDDMDDHEEPSNGSKPMPGMEHK